MKPALLLAMLAALTACGANPPKDQPHPRIEPSTLTPGIHVSGSASAGVSRTF